MVEGARLESVYTGNRIEGSNPSLSAINQGSPTGGPFLLGISDVALRQFAVCSMEFWHLFDLEGHLLSASSTEFPGGAGKFVFRRCLEEGAR